MTTIPLIIVGIYLLINLIIGILGYKATTKTAEDYFLANRTIGSLVFFFTMVATHISGFAVFGLSGMAYRSGFSAYEFSFLANGFVPIFLYVVGYRMWLLGKWRGYITPVEFFVDRYQSQALKLLILVVWIGFNLPFLAIQWTSAGYTLRGLTQGAISFPAGVVFLTLFTIAYVFLGGMKSVAWTDTFQGAVMFVAFTLCGVAIVRGIGLQSTIEKLYQASPEMFSRPGADGLVTPQWAVGMILMGISAFMAPQLFSRFFVPRSAKPFQVLGIMWIPAVSYIFVFSVLAGVLGKAVVPGLSGQKTDEVYSILLGRYASPLLQAIFSGGVLAALMSTASAVLLVLSSLFARDLYVTYINKQASEVTQVRLGKFFVALIGIASCVLALRSGATIFNLLVYAWSAFSMVLPATLAGLYWKRANRWGALSGTIAGLAIVLGEGNWIARSWMGGFPAIVPAFVLNSLVLLVVSWLTSSKHQVATGENFTRFLKGAIALRGER
ncbi:MAG: sodium:solute symporter family protein [Acidobacteria bacterium]|nr:sodium:solute symporter family protein [Acidobacteriota bacterium]